MTFWILLTVSDPGGFVPAAKCKGRHRERTLRVLVVEDHADLAEYARVVLSRQQGVAVEVMPAAEAQPTNAHPTAPDQTDVQPTDSQPTDVVTAALTGSN